MLKLLNVWELLGLYRVAFGLLLACVVLRCAALWCECVDSYGVCRIVWEAFGIV